MRLSSELDILGDDRPLSAESPEKRAARLGYQCRLEYRSGKLDPGLRGEALNHGEMLCRAQESPDMYFVLVQIFPCTDMHANFGW